MINPLVEPGWSTSQILVAIGLGIAGGLGKFNFLDKKAAKEQLKTILHLAQIADIIK